MNDVDIFKYNYINWDEYYKKNKIIDIKHLLTNNSYKEFFDENTQIIEEINKNLTNINNKDKIYPYPELLFSSINYLSLNDIKVIILGQDPYHNVNSNKVPNAMGLSFSIPHNAKYPPSLLNIYKNLLKNNKIDKIPKSGNLSKWINEGVLLLNCIYTVEEKQANSHQNIWNTFGDKLIKYISDNCEHIHFILWGSFANKKLTENLIDSKKHSVYISSHPSGLSCNKPLGKYPSFNDSNPWIDTINWNVINE